MGSILLLVMAFAFIFFVARGCVATQESTQVRKYVTNADSLLSESSDVGNKELQPILQDSGGDPSKLDVEALNQVAQDSEDLYLRALTYDEVEVPPEFEDAHHYLVSALGIRARATGQLAKAATGDAKGFTEALAEAVQDYSLSDAIISNHYLPAVQDSLEEANQQRDLSYLSEPELFMDYKETGFDVAAPTASVARHDPNALHGVEVAAVHVAGQPLYQNENIVLTGSDEPVFFVTVKNSGETPETGVEAEVILNTRAERQSQKATIGQLRANGGTAIVKISGFLPGELNETADVTVEAEPVKYEEYTKNNTLTGTVTFGI